VLLNKKYDRAVFNLNLKDKNGQTPLHYILEKQDYELYQIVLQDKHLDVNQVNDSDFYKPRRLTVIFSAFHKVLYSREKILMRRVFHGDLLNNYVSYGTLRQIKIDLRPIPVAYSNQVHHQLELDLFNPT